FRPWQKSFQAARRHNSAPPNTNRRPAPSAASPATRLSRAATSALMARENCAERLKQQVPKDSHQAFVRGIVFGLGGAFLGLILYAAFGILTGLVIGYVSLVF